MFDLDSIPIPNKFFLGQTSEIKVEECFCGSKLIEFRFRFRFSVPAPVSKFVFSEQLLSQLDRFLSWLTLPNIPLQNHLYPDKDLNRYSLIHFLQILNYLSLTKSKNISIIMSNLYSTYFIILSSITVSEFFSKIDIDHK